MLDYRLYFLDGAGHIQGVVEFDCADDEEAIALAQTYADGRAMELWRRDRWVRRLPEDERSSAHDPRELPR